MPCVNGDRPRRTGICECCCGEGPTGCRKRWFSGWGIPREPGPRPPTRRIRARSRSSAAPVLTELVRVEGRIDYDGPRDEPVRGLHFRGLTFTQGDRFPWHGRTGWGIQHDWEFFDSPTALVRFRGAEGCTVEDCRFANSAHAALRLDLHGIDNHIVGNVIERVGGCGVLLCGYGPGTKDCNRRNLVANNYIHDIGETYWHSSAVFAWQSGENRIVHNRIHDAPYCGIVVSCRAVPVPDDRAECSRIVRWNELPENYRKLTWQQREPTLHARNNHIERNDIHGVMEVMGDGNCIYVSGAGGGNIVRENYCHDVWGKHVDAAIRTDNDQHDTLIERNVITRIHGHACGICNKGGNQVLNNIVCDLRPTSVHYGCLVLTNYVPAGSRMRGNVLWMTRPGMVPVCEFGPHPGLSLSETGSNVYFSRVEPDWADAYLARERAAGRETGSVTTDPKFQRPEDDDFRVNSTSPLLPMGIKLPPPVSDMGLEPLYAERFFGRELRTVIEPASSRFRGPAPITIRSSHDTAEIRYTLDGAAPTLDSERYAGPFTLDRPVTVRATGIPRVAVPGADAAAAVGRLHRDRHRERSVLPGRHLALGLAGNSGGVTAVPSPRSWPSPRHRS